MNIAESLASREWWLADTPNFDPRYLWLIFIVTSIFLLLGIYLTVKVNPKNIYLKNYLKKWSALLNYCAALSYVLLFARWQLLPIFSKRIDQGILFVFFFLFSIYLAVYAKTKLKKQLSEKYKEDILNSYLPRNKNNKQ